MDSLVLLGLAIVIVGIFVIILGSALSGSNAKFAVGGFIGPIPFGFGNDRNLVILSIALSAAIIVFFLVANRFW